MRKMMLAALILMLALLPLCGLAEEEPIFYNGQEAMNEEDGASVFEVEPGTYEWYMLPGDIEDGHAYVDIQPEEETVVLQDGAWHYTFVMEEVGGVSFYPYTVVLVGFSDGVEVRRTTVNADTWWVGQIPADSLVTYNGLETNRALTALAISVIGTDATGYEQEFHGMVFLSK